MRGLLEVGDRGEVELARHDEACAAPDRAKAAGIDGGDIPELARGVVAGEGVAVTLVQIGVVIPEVEREYALSDAEADVPSGVARIGNAVRERGAASERATSESDLSAVEIVARSQPPISGLRGEVETKPIRQRVARSRDFYVARHVGAGRTGVEHRRRVVGRG